VSSEEDSKEGSELGDRMGERGVQFTVIWVGWGGVTIENGKTMGKTRWEGRGGIKGKRGFIGDRIRTGGEDNWSAGRDKMKQLGRAPLTGY